MAEQQVKFTVTKNNNCDIRKFKITLIFLTDKGLWDVVISEQLIEAGANRDVLNTANI